MIQKYTIGRNQDNNIVVYHPMVSGYHADLTINDNNGYIQYTLSDHSSNGTMVNGQMLHNSTCFIAYNDVILLAGQVLFDWNAIGRSNVYMPDANAYMATPEAIRQQMPHSFTNGRSIPETSFVQAIASFFTRYVDFSGRSSRKEYWFVVLWFFIFSAMFHTVFFSMVNPFGYEGFLYDIYADAAWYFVFWGFVGIATFLPSLALMVRRIHDTGKDGLWILMSLVPIANIVFFFIWTLSPSEPGTNKWG